MTGVGFEAKPQVALGALVCVVVLGVIGPRWVLRSPWLLSGVAAAVALALPYLWWQAAHGWPQVTVASSVADPARAAGLGSCRSSW